MKLAINKEKKVEATIRDHSFFLEYLKIIGMMLFAISMTTPVLGLVIFDIDTEVMVGNEQLDGQMIWDKPILPYIAGFIILVIHWFKFTEVNHSLKDTDINHILLNFAFFFILCLYPYFDASFAAGITSNACNRFSNAKKKNTSKTE